jgi:hypothetical protein
MQATFPFSDTTSPHPTDNLPTILYLDTKHTNTVGPLDTVCWPRVCRSGTVTFCHTCPCQLEAISPNFKFLHDSHVRLALKPQRREMTKTQSFGSKKRLVDLYWCQYWHRNKTEGFYFFVCLHSSIPLLHTLCQHTVSRGPIVWCNAPFLSKFQQSVIPSQLCSHPASPMFH